MGPSHDRKQKALRDVFLPAWDFDTCLAVANWNGSLSNEISARRTGSGKKVTHYNYSTWLTELSQLCSPTFTLISFRGAGVGAGACRGVRAHVCAQVSLICTLSTLFSFWLFIHKAKLKAQIAAQRVAVIFIIIFWTFKSCLYLAVPKIKECRYH